MDKDVGWIILIWIVIALAWFGYWYFIIQPVMNVPIWTVGGLLTFFGALALGIILAIITFLMFVATYYMREYS